MKRIILSLAAVLGLSAGPVAGKSITPDQAPAAWVAYAEQVTQTLVARLNSDDEPAPTVRAALDATRPAPDQPPAPLVVKLWIKRDGSITRAEFADLPDAGAADQLSSLIQAQRLAPPPRGMLQPLRIALQVSRRTGADGGS